MSSAEAVVDRPALSGGGTVPQGWAGIPLRSGFLNCAYYTGSPREVMNSLLLKGKEILNALGLFFEPKRRYNPLEVKNMDERILSGYCRCLDGARTVICEYEPGRGWSTDCLWPDCPHSGSCLLGREMEALPEEK